MTNQELNRDIKRLYKNLEKNKTGKVSKMYLIYIDTNARKEFHRLYGVDKSMQAMNKQSILIMLSINNSYRFIPLHQLYPHNFGESNIITLQEGMRVKIKNKPKDFGDAGKIKTITKILSDFGSKRAFALDSDDGIWLIEDFVHCVDHPNANMM